MVNQKVVTGSMSIRNARASIYSHIPPPASGLERAGLLWCCVLFRGQGGTCPHMAWARWHVSTAGLGKEARVHTWSGQGGTCSHMARARRHVSAAGVGKADALWAGWHSPFAVVWWCDSGLVCGLDTLATILANGLVVYWESTRALLPGGGEGGLLLLL